MSGNVVGEPVPPAQLAAAVAEVRSFVAELKRSGVMADDGSVADPGAVVTAVRAERERFGELARVLTGGGRNDVLCTVRGGVSALVVAIVGSAQP